MIHSLCCIDRDAKGFFILNGDIYEVLISLLLRSNPFTIFSGHILIHIKKRWEVLKRVEKGRFGHNYENCKILVREKYEKSKTRASLEPAQAAS